MSGELLNVSVSNYDIQVWVSVWSVHHAVQWDIRYGKVKWNWLHVSSVCHVWKIGA